MLLLFLRGEYFEGLDREFRLGLRGGLVALGRALVPLVGGMTWLDRRSIAEFARVDGAELPESEFTLSRRVLSGIRDWEFLFDFVEDVGEDFRLEGGICGRNVVAGRMDTPVKSLCVRRCLRDGSSGIAFSDLISSSVGFVPRYQADGDDVPKSCGSLFSSSGNIGLGSLILPSEPLRRLVTEMP